MGKPISLDYKRAIYGLKSSVDDQIRYIGQCTYAAERMALHRQRARQGQHLHIDLYKWIDEVGLDTISIEILEKFDENDQDAVNEAERKWIKALKDQGADLTNMTIGGYVSGPNHPSYGLKGKPLTEPHKQAMAEGRAKFFSSLSPEEKEARATKTRETLLRNSASLRASYARNQAERERKLEDAKDPESLYSIKSRGPHKRYHVNRNQPNPECQHCINEELV